MRDDGIGFGGVFLALFLALCAHDIVRLVVARLWLERTVRELTAKPLFEKPLYERQYTTAAQSPPRPMERWAGPIQARQQGISRSCINGRLADRNGNGWSDVRPETPCIATSE